MLPDFTYVEAIFARLHQQAKDCQAGVMTKGGKRDCCGLMFHNIAIKTIYIVLSSGLMRRTGTTGSNVSLIRTSGIGKQT